MKVFISWSGPTSGQIATELRRFLPLIWQGIQPFLSTDIDKGAMWQLEIAGRLEETGYGLACLTSDNLASQWLAFEAGALAKQHKEGRVSTILFGVAAGDVGYPLSMFQNTNFEHDDFRKLIGSMNDKFPPELRRNGGDLDELFEMLWPKIEEPVRLILSNAGATPPAPKRPVEDLLQELLGEVRQQGNTLARLTVTRTSQRATEKLFSRLNSRTLGGSLGFSESVLRSYIEEYLNREQEGTATEAIRSGPAVSDPAKGTE